jgi:LysM repeat protein
MFKQRKRYHLLIMFVVLIFITTACFRDSAESVVAQPVSQLLPTDTIIPTQEDEPSATPTEGVVFEKPTETSVPTATSTQTPVVLAETATMTLDPLLARLTATETEEGIVNVGNTIPGGTSIAQAATEAPPDNFALTSTALIGQLTQSAALAATTQAFQAGVGTTPTPIATATPNPFLVTPTLIPAQPLIPGANCIHQIRAGETLFKLSLAYGVPIADMQLASNIANPNLVLVGQRVTIPGCGTTGFTPPPTSIPVASSTPDSLSAQAAIVTGAGGSTVTTDSLAAQAQSDILNNAQADIQANAVAQGAAPLVGTRVHIVQQYETLFQIAQSFGTTVDAIAALNGITNINSITIGDELQIP